MPQTSPEQVPSAVQIDPGQPIGASGRKALQKRSRASTHALPRPGSEKTTPLGPGLITEPECRPRGQKSRELDPKIESGVPVPNPTQVGHRKPHLGGKAKI